MKQSSRHIVLSQQQKESIKKALGPEFSSSRAGRQGAQLISRRFITAVDNATDCSFGATVYGRLLKELYPQLSVSHSTVSSAVKMMEADGAKAKPHKSGATAPVKLKRASSVKVPDWLSNVEFNTREAIKILGRAAEQAGAAAVFTGVPAKALTTFDPRWDTPEVRLYRALHAAHEIANAARGEARRQLANSLTHFAAPVTRRPR